MSNSSRITGLLFKRGFRSNAATHTLKHTQLHAHTEGNITFSSLVYTVKMSVGFVNCFGNMTGVKASVPLFLKNEGSGMKVGY